MLLPVCAARTGEVAAFSNITLADQDAAFVRTLGAGQCTVAVTGAVGGTGDTRVGAADTTDIPSESVPPPPDVSEVCSQDLCATDATLAAECQDRLDACLQVEDADERVALAVITCQ